MIFGVGTDIVRVARIKDAMARHEHRFAMKILGPEEQQIFHARSESDVGKGVRYLATRFAAKEALSKAMGTGFRAPMSWHGAQLLNMENGRPQFVFDQTMTTWLVERNLRAHVSITDEHEYVVAFVILETSVAVQNGEQGSRQ